MSSDIILKGLIEKFTPDQFSKLLSFLPDSEKLTKIPSPAFIELKGFANFTEFVHYSWFIPLLKTYNKQESAYFLLLFPKEAGKKLQKILQLKFPSANLSKSGCNYLKSLLTANLIQEDLLPIEFLPKSPLNSLLYFSKKQLLEFIDYLALFDLAMQIPKIVQPQIIKNIQNLLLPEQLRFLKKLIKRKWKTAYAKLPLEKIEPAKTALYNLMHKRGLNRLSVALSQENSSLVWYLSHILDIGRGTSLFKLSGKKASKNISGIIIKDILETITFLKEKSE